MKWTVSGYASFLAEKTHDKAPSLVRDAARRMVSIDMSNQCDAAVEISFMQRNLVCSFRSYSWLSLKIVYELYFEIFASFNAYNGEE